MKTILLLILLFSSTIVVGQTKVKYIIKKDPSHYDFVLPVGKDSIVKKAVHGKKENMEMETINADY